ncbi:MAG: C25 family cysteine peptidase, partial [candidate division WOR-3 bacterium]|nr:C25 family cysteine peptidase [candidate division WOR-3 bacterium]
VIREFVEIPFGAKVDVKATVLRNEYIKLEHPVLPLQPPIPKTGPKPDFVINQDIYNASKNTFDVRAKIEMIGEIRGHRVALLEVYPVFYNPRENLVDYASEMTIEINLSGSDLLKTAEMRNRYYSKPYEMMLSNLVLNYDAYALTPPPDLPVGFLIIVPDEWASYVQPLAQWRMRKGYKVFVRTLSQVGGGTNTTVRNYILNAYNTWQIPPTFVLLVGDVDRIGYFTGQAAPTDLNYALMTTPDYFPDIDVSRASVANAIQLDSLIKKTVKYERNEWLYGNEWCKKAYFIASNDATYYYVAEGTHRYCMRLMRRYGVICDSLFLRNNSGTPVYTAINGGRAWVTYSGHGSISSWADNNFTSANVRQLANTDKVPIVGTYACNSGEYNSSSTTECFSETWIRVGYRGAIAHYASTVTSYWTEDDTLQRRVFDAALDSNFVWAMGMLNKGKLRYFLQMGNTTT